MDRGLQGLGVVGTFISCLIKVGTHGQGLNAEWEVRCCILVSMKKLYCAMEFSEALHCGAMGSFLRLIRGVCNS